MENENYLEHHGIKGQSWGDRNGPPYPLKPAISRAVKESAKKEPKQGIIAKYKANKIAKKRKAAQVEALKKAREEKDRKQQEEKAKADLKKKVTESRDPVLLYKHADLFSTDELREMKNRLSVEEEIKNLSPSIVDKGQQFIKKAQTTADVLGKTATVLDNGIKTYNNVAKVLNSMCDTKMPMIVDPTQNNGNKNKNNNNSNGNKNNSGNNKSTESFYTYDEKGQLRFSRLITNDGAGNKKTIERTYANEEKPSEQKQKEDKQREQKPDEKKKK